MSTMNTFTRTGMFADKKLGLVPYLFNPDLLHHSARFTLAKRHAITQANSLNFSEMCGSENSYTTSTEVTGISSGWGMGLKGLKIPKGEGGGLKCFQVQY